MGEPSTGSTESATRRSGCFGRGPGAYTKGAEEAGPRAEFEPHRGHTRRDGIAGKEVLSEGCELWVGVLIRRLPSLDGLYPIGMVQRQGQQAIIQLASIVSGIVGVVKKRG
jgi:hypothetical protein